MKQKKDGVFLCNAEKNLPKVKQTVVFWMHFEWSGLRILAIFRYVTFFSALEKILRGTKVNLLVDYSYKIHLQDILVHMRGP